MFQIEATDEYMKISEFYAPNVPTSPLPAMFVRDNKV